MNYKKQYERLINRARQRTLGGYAEIHHILPRCLGGTDEEDNLVSLTAREHFTAHVLLVKMYPKEYGLIKAVNQMCRFNKRQDRSKNRMYGWLRAKFAKEMSRNQTGEGNSQFGSCWVCKNSIPKKVKKTELDSYLAEGWIRGRKQPKKLECINCLKIFMQVSREKSCSEKCLEEYRTNFSKKNYSSVVKALEKKYGKYWASINGRKGGLAIRNIADVNPLATNQ